jgi:hypothetical protein
MIKSLIKLYSSINYQFPEYYTGVIAIYKIAEMGIFEAIIIVID